MKQLISVLIFISILISSSCNSNKEKNREQSKLSGTISLSGAFALYPMVVEWKDEYNKIYPDVRIEISAGGAGKGIADALSGIVDFGMVSREISKTEIEKGAWFIPIVKDAVVGVINSDNPVKYELLKKGITKDILAKIFITGEIKTWGEAIGDPSKSKDIIVVYTRSDACGAADTWAKYLGQNQEDLNGVGVFGDPGIAQAVQNDKLGIGYNNIGFAFNANTKNINPKMMALSLDINKNNLLDASENFYYNLDTLLSAISKNQYPSPPARDLYLVTNGKPTNNLVLHFLKWILTDGQKFVKESGYIRISDEKIKISKNKLN